MEYISRSQLEELEETAMDRDINISVRERYSGRGMFGEYCVGLIVPSMLDAFRTAIMISNVLPEDLAQYMFDHLSTDEMGLGTIIYFPGLQAREEAEEVHPAS